MPARPADDLRWVAFLYISGDLDPNDEAAFETRLADDQAAREAVAEAVELAGAVARVGSDLRIRSRSRTRPVRRIVRALAWSASVAAAACLAFAVISGSRPPAPVSNPTSTPFDASEVARAWSGLRLDSADPDWAAGPIAGVDPSTESGVESETESESESEVVADSPADRDLPSWLLSAASAPLPEGQ